MAGVDVCSLRRLFGMIESKRERSWAYGRVWPSRGNNEKVAKFDDKILKLATLVGECVLSYAS